LVATHIGIHQFESYMAAGIDVLLDEVLLAGVRVKL
jgi:hypothetical protein